MAPVGTNPGPSVYDADMPTATPWNDTISKVFIYNQHLWDMHTLMNILSMSNHGGNIKFGNGFGPKPASG